MWVRPSWGTVFSGVVLMGRDIHLVEMNLWNVGVRGGVDALGGYHGDDDRFRFEQPSLGDLAVDIGDGGGGNVVNCDDVAIT